MRQCPPIRSTTVTAATYPSVWRNVLRLSLVGAAVAAVLVCGFLAPGSAPRATAGTRALAAKCPKGSVVAAIGKRSTCLRAGQACDRRLDAQYHPYWFHCHSGRLAALPSAGRIVASIPVPAVGGLAIGAGSVWAANMNPYTVTRIDPATNAVVATIPLGEPDFSWGPTRLAFGHGFLWVLDAKSSSVLQIDPDRNRIAGRVSLGTPVLASSGPLGVAVTPDALWVANSWGTTSSPDGSVVAIDPETMQIVANVALGSSPDNSGPAGIAAGHDSLWVGVPSRRSVVRIDPTTASPVAEIRQLECARGQLAVDASGVWAADCTSVRRIDPTSNAVTRSLAMPRATGMGVVGVAAGLGSIWVQAGALVRIDPASGQAVGVVPLAPVWNDCGYSIVFGFGSIWVRQHDRVVRIQPSP